MTDTATTTVRPVLVGVDGSGESREALRWAVEFGRMTGAPVEAVAAWAYPQVGYGWYGAVPQLWQPEADTKTMLDETVDAVLGAVEGARVGRRVTEGPPASVLIEASCWASALVVGSRGHGGFAGLLLGSVSSACAEHAYCPVVVLHGTPTPDPAAETATVTPAGTG